MNFYKYLERVQMDRALTKKTGDFTLGYQSRFSMIHPIPIIALPHPPGVVRFFKGTKMVAKLTVAEFESNGRGQIPAFEEILEPLFWARRSPTVIVISPADRLRLKDAFMQGMTGLSPFYFTS